jgi:hypothetical protein
LAAEFKISELKEGKAANEKKRRARKATTAATGPIERSVATKHQCKKQRRTGFALGLLLRSDLGGQLLLHLSSINGPESAGSRDAGSRCATRLRL